MRGNKKSNTAYGIIGLGRFGKALAVMLAESGKDVVAIDQNELKVREIRQYTEYAFVTEDLSKEALKETGIQNCDVVVVLSLIHICLLDLMFTAKDLIGLYYKTTESLFLLVVFYLLILLPVSIIGSLLERRLRYAGFGD